MNEVIRYFSCFSPQYTMLSGQVPFQSSRSFRSSDFIMQRITHGDIRFEGQQWESISPAAKDLIKGLMSEFISSLKLDPPMQVIIFYSVSQVVIYVNNSTNYIYQLASECSLIGQFSGPHFPVCSTRFLCLYC